LLPALLAEIALHPKTQLTFLTTPFGKPFTAAGFGNWFRDRCNEAGLPHCSAHGLRKAAAVHHALNGATAFELMAWFGWRTIGEAQRYGRCSIQLSYGTWPEIHGFLARFGAEPIAQNVNKRPIPARENSAARNVAVPSHLLCGPAPRVVALTTGIRSDAHQAEDNERGRREQCWATHTDCHPPELKL
jgi:hypothetical protein